MNELIAFENGQLKAGAVDYITALEAQYKQLKADLLQAMEENGITKIESDTILINYIQSGTRETVDTKALKEDFPDLVNNYTKISAVLPSIRIKLK